MVASLEESGVRESLKEIRALGNVRVRQGGRTAKAHQAVFDQRNRRVTLTGNVELRDGSNEIRGARLVVFLDERRSIIEGGPGDRVRAVLYPSRTAIEE
jgi:lipopolysaccharide export system protein LptA